MTELNKAAREGEVAAKEAWRKRDGEDLSDKVANARDEISKDVKNTGDDVRNAIDDAADKMQREADKR